METLIFVTHNENKIKEIKAQLADAYHLRGLTELGVHEEIPETTGSIEGNALQKAQYFWDRFRQSCFADDSGLEVEALSGEPGVDSAHYAGTRDSNENINLLLTNLANHAHTHAQFRTVIALILDGEKYFFEGIIKGNICREKRGEGGFGYDPIFIPEGYQQTFAEMDLAEKNKMSHRARAVAKLIDFLEKKQQ
jgi:XTP/dITP diphosphohydrolase